MKSLEMTVVLEYDEESMHGNEPEAIDWFHNFILLQKGGSGMLLLHSNEIGDTVGEIKVLALKE